MDEYDDPNEPMYLQIRADLYARYPLAAFGPGHVVLDDHNWDFYQSAIEYINAVLAYRALTALGLPVDVLDGNEAAEFAAHMEWYADHGTEELAATLAALELIKWHEEGRQGPRPDDGWRAE